MRFYDAELTRLGALTTDDDAVRRADLQSAIGIARSQDARIFELRAALDYFGLDPDAGRQLVTEALAHFPGDSTWPDVMRSRTLLG